MYSESSRHRHKRTDINAPKQQHQAPKAQRNRGLAACCFWTTTYLDTRVWRWWRLAHFKVSQSPVTDSKLCNKRNGEQRRLLGNQLRHCDYIEEESEETLQSLITVQKNDVGKRFMQWYVWLPTIWIHVPPHKSLDDVSLWCRIATSKHVMYCTLTCNNNDPLEFYHLRL